MDIIPAGDTAPIIIEGARALTLIPGTALTAKALVLALIASVIALLSGA